VESRLRSWRRRVVDKTSRLSEDEDQEAYRITPHGIGVLRVIDRWPNLSLDEANALAHQIMDEAIALAEARGVAAGREEQRRIGGQKLRRQRDGLKWSPQATEFEKDLVKANWAVAIALIEAREESSK
jgi:hypothetical protein